MEIINFDDYLEDTVFTVYDKDDFAVQVITYDDALKLIKSYYDKIIELETELKNFKTI